MPIYEYECKNCGHRFEHLQKMTDEPPHTCPECGKEQLVKLASNTSFQLKGTGWYATDFKNPAPKKTENTNKLETKTKETTTSEKPKDKVKE